MKGFVNKKLLTVGGGLRQVPLLIKVFIIYSCAHVLGLPIRTYKYSVPKIHTASQGELHHEQEKVDFQGAWRRAFR